jgi:hypothetical protein
MEINCERQLCNMRGDPFKITEIGDDGTKKTHVATVGEYVADILGMDKTEHFKPMKAYELGRKFGTQKTVTLDGSDWLDLKSVLDESNRAPIIVGQIREYFAELDQQLAREKSKK